MSLPADIDTLKAAISKRGGLATNNRFAVYITHPNQSKNGLLNLSADNLLSKVGSSLISGNSIDPMSFVNDPRDMFLLCESLQIPGKRIATMENAYSHFTVKKPYSVMTEDITMVFHLTNDYYVRKYFDSWQNMIVENGGAYKVHMRENYATDVTIQQLSADQGIIPAYGIKLINAYPMAISGVDMSNASSGETARVTITWAYDTWEELGVVDGFKDLLGKGKGIVTDTVGQLRNFL